MEDAEVEELNPSRTCDHCEAHSTVTDGLRAQCSKLEALLEFQRNRTNTTEQNFQQISEGLKRKEHELRQATDSATSEKNSAEETKHQLSREIEDLRQELIRTKSVQSDGLRNADDFRTLSTKLVACEESCRSMESAKIAAEQDALQAKADIREAQQSADKDRNLYNLEIKLLQENISREREAFQVCNASNEEQRTKIEHLHHEIERFEQMLQERNETISRLSGQREQPAGSFQEASESQVSGYGGGLPIDRDALANVHNQMSRSQSQYGTILFTAATSNILLLRLISVEERMRDLVLDHLQAKALLDSQQTLFHDQNASFQFWVGWGNRRRRFVEPLESGNIYPAWQQQQMFWVIPTTLASSKDGNAHSWTSMQDLERQGVYLTTPGNHLSRVNGEDQRHGTSGPKSPSILGKRRRLH
ncbi:hypothetical protein KC318_g432 [Hortaea werneckii]|nr:hypothetical protein KC334_g400 [Hortaea werneckii]KAI7027343.1 hypothetical protein KC355_g367 [Hortaea werneckii]KAI7676192.1 hypothetical protein KC318_g432 [Hortaea werneckii]